MFWMPTYRLRADVGCTNSRELRLTMAGDVLDLFVWSEVPAQAMAGYVGLTGAAIVPPKWAFKSWMGGGGRRWANGPLKNVVNEELFAVQRFHALDIPHAAIYAEAGNADPKLYAGLTEDNPHVLAWVYAAMKLDRMRELLPGAPDHDLPVVIIATVRWHSGSMMALQSSITHIRAQLSFYNAFGRPASNLAWPDPWWTSATLCRTTLSFSTARPVRKCTTFTHTPMIAQSRCVPRRPRRRLRALRAFGVRR